MVPGPSRSRRVRRPLAPAGARAGPAGPERRLPGPTRSTPGRSCSSIRRVLAYFWPFAREEPHGHPPFYALLGLAGDLLAPTWQDLPRARLGPILLFSLTAGVLFHVLARRWGFWAAAAGVGAWVFQPNLFGHGHYATYDAVLSSLWVLAILSFAAAAIPAEPGRSAT